MVKASKLREREEPKDLLDVNKELEKFHNFVKLMKENLKRHNISNKEMLNIMDDMVEIILMEMASDLRTAINILFWSCLNLVYKYGMRDIPKRRENNIDDTRYIG